MAKTQWMLYTKRADFQKIAARFSVSPVLVRIMINRGVPEDGIGRYLNGTIRDLYDPHLLTDLDAAVKIIREAVEKGEKIRIIGDYDIDGVCSTYILLTAMKRIGADADYDIPDRIKDGYGINEAIIREAEKSGAKLLLTCDNGIGAAEEIACAKKLGMTVIVTDHHEIFRNADGTELLPCADAVIDPKREGCPYPFREICGAVVAWKLVQALYENFGIPEAEWEALLPFAAIATVGDVMRLQDENRIIVKYGLQGIAQCKNTGLRKLIESCGLDPSKLSAYHIGFVIGPCLNAGGRLESAKTALRMLNETDPAGAEKTALHLKELNDERKAMTSRGVEEAKRQADSLYRDQNVLVIYLPDCHESVAGIIAGRLREEYHKPSIILTDSSREDCLKGSGRSVEAYHMFHALEAASDLLLKFGGHPMAAGLSLDRHNEEALRKRLNDNAVLTQEDLTEKIWIDAAMPFSYVSEPFIRELELLEPCGQGNERPLFAQKNVEILSTRILGRERNVVKLTLRAEEGTRMDAVLFSDGEAFIREMGDRRCFDVLYYPALDSYRGRNTPQVVIKGWKFHG